MRHGLNKIDTRLSAISPISAIHANHNTFPSIKNHVLKSSRGSRSPVPLALSWNKCILRLKACGVGVADADALAGVDGYERVRFIREVRAYST